MSRRILFAACLSLLVFIVFYSCQKSVDPLLENPQNVSTTVAGRVFDENKNPVVGAKVTAGNRTVSTDIDGRFQIANAALDKDAAYIKVEKEGYLNGSRTILAKPNTKNNITIELLPRKVEGTFISAVGGSVALSFGGRITFQANGVINATTKAAYAGNVSVAAAFLDPTAPNFTEIMPGDLRGITVNNEERGLQSFGMMGVELVGSGGEKLQLAAGRTATINFPIPASIQSTAPATIPLWYFDEVKGLWQEEGSATKQGGFYVGTVSHFSYWNCDVPYPLVKFEAVIRDAAGNFLPEAVVAIKSTSDSGMVRSATTDDAGSINGLIPANKVLNITIYNKCNTIIYSKNIGPFSNDTNLGSIVTAATPGAAAKISGNVTNCNGTAVTNCFVAINISGMNYRANVTNGTFNVTIPTCTSGAYSASLFAYDVATNSQGTATTVNGTTGVTANANLTACGTIANQFINYTIGTTNYALVAPADSLFAGHSFGETKIYSFGQSRNFYMNFGGGTTTGTKPLTYLMISGGNVNVVNSGSINVNVSQFGNVSDFIIGNFTGTVKDSTGPATYPITCNFKIRRSN